MLDYDFHTLSPIEFEALCRDLLQKQLDITLESFSSGRDGGIDFRYSKPEDTNDFIVQCKRYVTSFAKLRSHLKSKELAKVKTLNPKRYILATSVSLTANQKKHLLEDFAPYIISASDIYGREDINNLLGVYKDIETQHYKLWLSSTRVLQNILHSDIVNRTYFAEEDIKSSVATYVENDSYPKTLEVFKKHRFVTIAGEPGIGKTTLARILIYRMLANKQFDQFVYISRGVEEAWKLFEPGKKQLFFFDDFLGRNIFEKGLQRNEEVDLINFIQKVIESKNKGLIFTTREYILRQAQTEYSDLRLKLFGDHEYVINLEVYTKKIRANILYNHLFTKGLPLRYLKSFLDESTYTYLINHRNYTPRLIETILSEEPWNDIKPNEFPNKFKSYFDDPTKIWRDVYENGISSNARLLMKTLLTLRTPVDLTKLHAAFESCSRSTGSRPDFHVFDRAIRELENTFIATRSSYNYRTETSTLVVDYKNPSILDFMVKYYSTEARDDLAIVLENAIFIDQFTLRFRSEQFQATGYITLTDKLKKLISENILKGFDQLPFSVDPDQRTSSFSSFGGRLRTYIEVIDYLLWFLDMRNDTATREYLFNAFLKANSSSQASEIEFNSQHDVLELFSAEMNDKDKYKAVEQLAKGISTLEELDIFNNLVDDPYLHDQVIEWLSKNSLYEELTDILLSEIEDLDNEGVHKYYSETLPDLSMSYDFDSQAVQSRLEDIISENQISFEPTDFRDDEIIRSANSAPSVSVSLNENDEIKDMFESLR